MSTSALILVSGSFLALMAVVAGWLFRTASAPFLVKMIIPISLMVLACATPYQLPSILGWPVETTFASLPAQAELLAFHPYDDEKMVYLWLQPPASGPCGNEHYGECLQPRAYSVELTDDLKNTLRQVQKAKADGAPAMLAKKGKPRVKRPHQQYSDMDGGEGPYTLLPNAFALPKKDTPQ